MSAFALGPVARVGESLELIRIVREPRRVLSNEDLQRLADQMTAALKTPTGTMSLRPLQAAALYEIGTVGGLFGPLRVGLGKTILSLLAPVACFAQRPLLLVPAKLVGKTNRDRAFLSQHWDIPVFMRIMTYEWLGRVQASDALEQYRPDFIFADEVHKLRNRSAAVVRRVFRYMAAHPETKFAGASGTITKRSLHDYAHIILWALKNKTPLPKNYSDLELWADALDERKGQIKRADPGALEVFCNEEEKKLWATDKHRAARLAFRRRLVETAGVVASVETPIDATLSVQAQEFPVSAALEAAFLKLRTDWETPDGWPIMDGLDLFRHSRELALGFFYKWDPRPPDHWLVARKAWSKFVRQALKHSQQHDSELQVRRAHPDAPELRAWQAVVGEFEPNTVPVWIDDSALKFCAEWAKQEKGIIWTEHTVFGERLASDFGLAYYGRGGLNAAGRPIESHPVGTPLVASIQSNAEGRNLQAWSTNLVTSFPPNGGASEQLIGRTHRDGQEADEVSFDVLCLCAEHVGALWQAVKDCRYVADSTGSPQKLLLAGIDFPMADDLALRQGARWNK